MSLWKDTQLLFSSFLYAVKSIVAIVQYLYLIFRLGTSADEPLWNLLRREVVYVSEVACKLLCIENWKCVTARNLVCICACFIKLQDYYALFENCVHKVDTD
jgi:hypothetical protein